MRGSRNISDRAIGSCLKGLPCLFLMAGLAAVVMMSGCISATPRVVEVKSESGPAEMDRRAKIYLELGTAYFTRGNQAAALEEIKKVLAIKPKSIPAYNLQGLVYASNEEPQKAEVSFQKALEIDAKDFDTRHNYAWFLCQRKRFDEADKIFGALVVEPDYRDAQRSLLAQGVCRARANKLPDAEKTLSRAFEVNPGNPAVAVNLAEVLYREGQYERARFYIRRVNNNADYSTAQTLWLAMRIENKMNEEAQVRVLGQQLRNRFPNAPETLLYEKGRFDD
jgi:type IV pilus assembly protein PilF